MGLNKNLKSIKMFQIFFKWFFLKFQINFIKFRMRIKKWNGNSNAFLKISNGGLQFKISHLIKTYSFGGNNTGAIGSNQTRLVLCQQSVFYTHHIVLWHTFSNADNQWNLSFESFHNGSCCTRWWYIDDGGMRICSLFGFSNLWGRKNFLLPYFIL